MGQSMGHTISRDMTPGWRVVYFLRRHGNRATDDQIQQFTGLSPEQVNVTMRKLTSGKNPVVTVLSS